MKTKPTASMNKKRKVSASPYKETFEKVHNLEIREVRNMLKKSNKISKKDSKYKSE